MSHNNNFLTVCVLDKKNKTAARYKQKLSI